MRGCPSAFEYTVFQRGWSRITSDVFRLVRRALRDAVALFVANTHQPGLYLTLGWYHPASEAFSAACAARNREYGLAHTGSQAKGHLHCQEWTGEFYTPPH